jgi:hypothetical protein
MDTDDFSNLAYSLISRASQVSDTLKMEIGIMSREYTNEDDWLRGVQTYCRKIIATADDFVDSWDLEQG